MRRRLTSTVLHWRRTTALCAVPCGGRPDQGVRKPASGPGTTSVYPSDAPSLPSVLSRLSSPSLQMFIAPTDETSRPEHAREPLPRPRRRRRRCRRRRVALNRFGRMDGGDALSIMCVNYGTSAGGGGR